jgi:prolycopene isomerase
MSMENKVNTEVWDVIVIGGGLSGLTAAITAARRGRKVLLLEKYATTGGLAAGFTRKGYYFDSGMSRCMDYIRKPLREVGVKADLKPQQSIWNIGGCWADYSSLERFFTDLEGIFPEERSGLHRLYENEIRPAEAILATFFGSMDGGNFVEKALGMLRLLGAMRAMQKAKSLQGMEAEVFGKYLDPGGRAYAFLIEREDEVDYRGEMNFFTKAGKLYSQTLNFYPSNGYQGLADDMEAALQALHGEVRTCADVEKILIENKQAVGVQLKAHGRSETINAKKIICSIDLNKTLHRLIGDEYLDAGLLERLAKSKLARAIPILYLGVDIPPEKIKKYFQGREEVCYCPEINPDPDSEHFFRDHTMVVHASCFHNPAHAPAGKTNLQVYLSCPPDGWMENWGLVNGARTERYREIKEMVIADLLSTLEKLIPELRARIEVCELGTPFTLERYTGNTDGSCMGFRMDADYINSRKFGAYFDRCPGIANLYFAGQQAGYPGGALSAFGSGKHAGKLV